MDILLDRLNTESYLRDIWNKKYGLGLYFSAMEDLGCSLYVPLKIQKKNEELKSYKIHHALHDGFSVLNQITADLGVEFQTPQFKLPRRPGVFKILKGLLNSKPSQAHVFTNQKEISPSTDYYYDHLEFDQLNFSLSTTSTFANIFAKSCMKNFSTNSISRWMVPVRMNDKSGLQASYIGLEVNESDCIKTTNNSLKTGLKSGEYWGFYYIGLLGIFLGKWFIQLMTKKSLRADKTLWMGAISNLGDIKADDSLEQLLIMLPVRWHRPLGLVLYTLNGKQYAVFSAHKSLSQNHFEKVIEDVKYAALSL